MNYISDNTRRLFDILGISSQFLNKDVNFWKEDKDYKKVKKSFSQ